MGAMRPEPLEIDYEQRQELSPELDTQPRESGIFWNYLGFLNDSAKRGRWDRFGSGSPDRLRAATRRAELQKRVHQVLIFTSVGGSAAQINA